MIRLLVRLAVIGFIVYIVFYRISAETRHRALAAVGADRFVEETIPRFLREKLSIPQNPTAKRKQLLGELSEKIGAVERELEAVIPAGDGKPSAGAKLPAEREIRDRIEKSRSALAESESLLDELGKINSGEGVVRKTVSRLLDTILPPSEPESPAGVDGAVGGSAECACGQ